MSDREQLTFVLSIYALLWFSSFFVLFGLNLAKKNEQRLSFVILLVNSTLISLLAGAFGALAVATKVRVFVPDVVILPAELAVFVLVLALVWYRVKLKSRKRLS